MMTKDRIYALLAERTLWHEVTEHPAVFNMAKVAQVPLPYPDSNAKNLFLRDDKKTHYYVVTVKGDERVNLKALRHRLGTRALCFASNEDLADKLGLFPGAVTPLGLLNNRDADVALYVDRRLATPDLIGLHPNDNTATVWMKTTDLMALIREHGNPVDWVTLRDDTPDTPPAP